MPPYALDDPDFDVLAHAQEMDFTDLRPFRQSLIVHTEAQFSRRPQPARIFDLHTATPARRNAEGVFETGLADIEISDPQMAQAIAQTSGFWPATLPVRELIEDEARAAALLRMYWAGVIALQTRAAAFPVEPGERPAASPLARLQAARGETRLATLNHGTVEVTDRFSLKFIAGLDGSRTQAQLAQDTAAELGLPLAAVAAQIETNLAALARMPLLVS